MKEIVIRHRIYTWAGVCLLMVSAGKGYREYCADSESGWYVSIISGSILALVFCLLGTQKTVISETGIESGFLFWRSLRPWDQVIQAGIAKVADRGDWGAYLLLTFVEGEPKTSAMGYSDWKNRNPNTCVHIPASDELRELVTRFYGPLDFDQTK